jgi:hypothetical protein
MVTVSRKNFRTLVIVRREVETLPRPARNSLLFCKGILVKV